MNRTLFAASLVTLSLLAACDKDASREAPAARMNATPSATAAAPVATLAAPVAAGRGYEIAKADSKVGFVGAKITATHEGTFATFSGTVTAPDGKADKGSVNVSVDMASLAIEPAKLAGHLKSKDLFDVASFPNATFASTAIAPRADGKFDVTGDLTLHGVKKSITFPAAIAVGADSVKADAEFSINRKDFGIVYPGMPDDLIKDNVVIKFAIVAKPKA